MIRQTFKNKVNKKGFTLMEILVTIILVAVLASYGVYSYLDVMEEGRYNAAKGKLAALGGATARYLLERSPGFGDTCNSYSININIDDIPGTCDPASDREMYMYNVFRCGYADKNLGIADGFNFSFGCPNDHDCGLYDGMTAFIKPVDGQSDIVPACAYFDPDTDTVVEIRSGN